MVYNLIMDKANEIPLLKEHDPSKTKGSGQAYLEALYDPTGPKTQEYALKIAQHAYTEAQTPHSAQATSTTNH